jgi:general stress protein YciG
MSDTSSRGLASANAQTRHNVAKMGGNARAKQMEHEDYQDLGHKGGKAAQKSGNAHKLTPAERSRGGQVGGIK